MNSPTTLSNSAKNRLLSLANLSASLCSALVLVSCKPSEPSPSATPLNGPEKTLLPDVKMTPTRAQSLLRDLHSSQNNKTPQEVLSGLTGEQAREYRKALIEVAFGSLGPAPLTYDDNPFSRDRQKNCYAIETVAKGCIAWLQGLKGSKQAPLSPVEIRQLTPKVLGFYVCAYTFLDQDKVEASFQSHLLKEGTLRSRGQSAKDILAWKASPGISQVSYLAFCEKEFSPKSIRAYVSPNKAQTVYKLWKAGLSLDCLLWHTVHGDHIHGLQPCHTSNASPEQFAKQKKLFVQVIRLALASAPGYAEDAGFRDAVDHYSTSFHRPPGGNGLKAMNPKTGATPSAKPAFQLAADRAGVQLMGWTDLGDTSREKPISREEALKLFQSRFLAGEHLSLLCHFHHSTITLSSSGLFNPYTQFVVSHVADGNKDLSQEVAKKEPNKGKMIEIPFHRTISLSLQRQYGIESVPTELADLVLKATKQAGLISNQTTHRSLPDNLRSIAIPEEIDQRLKSGKSQ